MDATEAIKWASGFTVLLGGGALGLKKLLTTWGKESAQATGMAAANDIIDSLRAEIERTRKHSDYMSSQYEETMLKVMALQKTVAQLRNENSKLRLNNMNLRDDSENPTTFTDTDIGKIE